MRWARALPSAFRSAASLPLAAPRRARPPRHRGVRLPLEAGARGALPGPRAAGLCRRERGAVPHPRPLQTLCRYPRQRAERASAARRLLGDGADDAHGAQCARRHDGDRCRGQFRLLHDLARGAGRRDRPCLRDRAGAADRGDAAPFGRAQRLPEIHDRDRGRRRRRRGSGRRCSSPRARAEKRATRASADGRRQRRRHGAPGRRNRRLDALLAERRRVDFVKIDAEGAEESVIAGMLATLRRDRRPWCSNSMRRGRATPTGCSLR